MDRFAAMIILLLGVVTMVLLLLSLFMMAPVVCSCLFSLLYSLYLFVAYEEAGVHHAQEFENRFWTVFAMLLSTALIFASDSPLAFGLQHPAVGLVAIFTSGYLMHLYDRYQHRLAISRNIMGGGGGSGGGKSKASIGGHGGGVGGGGAAAGIMRGLRRSGTHSHSSYERLVDLGIPVEEQLARINACLHQIDQLLIPSTINNFLNQRFVFAKEREVITIFQECDARALNYLISHVKLGLLFYKIKDHRNFNGKHRTELINLLAVERLSILTVISRVILLHSLQLLKLRANPQAENWVRNILLQTHQDDLSELKTLTDSKGDYFCMPKLIYDDIRSEAVRQDILRHIRREAAIQQTHIQMGTKRWRSLVHMQWRKVLSDVDDTLYCSGGMYPAGVDKRFCRKTVYPGVLAFYRELDLGIAAGPEEEWPDDRVGNLVFLSARPHVYKDMSEKANYAKFEKLRAPTHDGRKGLHTMPSLLAGDLASGSSYIVTNDLEPLAKKKFDNFRRYVSIYPEFQHVFVCDNGQGDVRAGEMMFDSFPYEFEALYVHVVTDVDKTYGYAPQRWRHKEFRPYFFTTYPQAALHAATRYPPLIRLEGLRRICADAVQDFAQIKTWPDAAATKRERRVELNQAVWRANQFLQAHGKEAVELIPAERIWADGEKVRTPYGIGTIRGFDAVHDLYSVELDWRPLNEQVDEHQQSLAEDAARKKDVRSSKKGNTTAATAATNTTNTLETVLEDDEPPDEQHERREASRPTEQQGGESSAEKPEAAEDHHVVSTQPSGESESPTARVAAPAAAAVEQEESAADSTAAATRDDTKAKPAVSRSGARAQIGGRYISKYTPPVLPKVVDTTQKRPSLFAFRGASGTTETNKDQPVAVGDQCNTPYGHAKVLEYRKNPNVVVVEFVGWKAKGYLQQDTIQPIKSLLGSFLQRLSSLPPDPAAEPKPDFPFAEGTKISTAFGPGSLVRPIVSPRKAAASRPDPSPSKQDTEGESSLRPPSNKPTSYQTVAISLDSWKLADGSSPLLYCTPETAKTWKEQAEDRPSIFSALGTLSRTLLLDPFRAATPKPKEKPPAPPPPRFKRYYQDGASVTTEFGRGVVQTFRPEDGMYQVSLVGWALAGPPQRHPTAFLRKDDMKTCIAKGCQEGYPVLTNLGVSGTLASVEPTTGVHIVTLPTSPMVCYLQPDCIIVPLKAAVGEDVSTAFGEGRVVFYNPDNDMYRIQLDGWNGTLYAKSDTFERLGEGIQDRDGPFGVKWLLRFLFFSSDGTTNSSSVTTRSRSNSLVSGSQQSNRSVS